MIEISKFIIVDKIFNESECCKIIDSKSEFIKSPEEQQNNKKSLIVPDESNYTFGHTNFPYWHLEFSDENEWFFEKVRESIDMVNMKFFKFENQGLWDSGIKEYSNGNGCSWHYDDMSRGKRLGISILLNKPEKGGEFEIFNGEKISIDLKVGEVVIFPTFLFHRVKPIVQGKRIALLTWMYSKPINF